MSLIRVFNKKYLVRNLGLAAEHIVIWDLSGTWVIVPWFSKNFPDRNSFPLVSSLSAQIVK
jgi:hypothetical protein